MLKEPPSHRPSAGRASKSALAGAGAQGNARVRRGYFECRYGQLHVHNAIPAGGGFEEGTPLLCLHPSPLSGRVFERFLAVAGADRSIFAPDLPGFGDSDPPPQDAGLAEHAAAIGDFLDTMRLRRVDLLGHGFGALVAVELASARPDQIRRIVLVSPPPSREGGPRVPPGASSEAAPSRRPPAADGSHLLEEWGRAVAYCGAGATPDIVSTAVAERLRNSAQAAGAAAAERDYPLRARLAQLSVPLLVLRLGSEAESAREVPARARLIELPEHGGSVFQTAPETAAQALEAFLR
ncbi:MAG: alpha/beta fold hydrolase [Steroidobacteraceae bacterium]